MSDPAIIPSWEDFDVLVDAELDDLITQHDEAKAEADEAEARRKDLNSQIEALLEAIGEKTVLFEDRKVTRVVRRSASRIDPKALRKALIQRKVKAAVASAAVEEATVPGKEYSYASISAGR